MISFVCNWFVVVEFEWWVVGVIEIGFYVLVDLFLVIGLLVMVFVFVVKL